MEFLVQIAITLPSDARAEERERLVRSEYERGRELMAAGILSRIWRVPGTANNVGIWSAPDATALHELISSLPMYPYMDVQVRPLSTHPLEVPNERHPHP